MSLYLYTYNNAEGKAVMGKITAKDDTDALSRIEKKHPGIEILKVSEQAAEPSPKRAGTDASKRIKSLNKLGRLLYLQSNQCFFCGEKLKEEDASVEHLHPVSQGGKSDESNEVVCCATLNQIFGNMTIRRKFEFVIKNQGNFVCPMKQK